MSQILRPYLTSVDPSPRLHSKPVILSRLRYPILIQPTRLSFLAALSIIAGHISLGAFPALHGHFSYLVYLFVSSGYILNSVLNAVIIIAFEHPSISSPALVCTAYSSFSAITFVKTHILILISRFESLGITFALSVFALPLSMPSSMCASQ